MSLQTTNSSVLVNTSLKDMVALQPSLLYRLRDAVSNRWLRLILWFCTMLLTSCPYYGWQFMRQYMERDGILADICPNGPVYCDPSIAEISPAACPDGWTSTGADCDEQAIAFATGNSIASGMEYGMGLFAGIMFDNFGPLPTAALGCILHVISWPLVLQSNTQTSFNVGMAFMGGAVNFICFPSLILLDLFPGHEIFMNGVVLCAQVGAALVMPLLWEFRHLGTFQQVMYVYLGAVTLPLFVMYLITMPYSRRDMQREYLRRGLVPMKFEKPRWRTFFAAWRTPEVWVFLVWYVLIVCQTGFYNGQLAELTSPRIAEIIGYIWMIQGPFSLVMSWLNDYLMPTVHVCLLINILMIMAWTLSPNMDIGGSPSWVQDLTQCMAGIMFVLQNSHIYTTKYNFAFEMYPREHIGKMSGGIGLFAGLLQSVNIIFDNHVPLYVTYVVYGLLALPELIILGWIFYRQFVKFIRYTDEHITWKLAELGQEGLGGAGRKDLSSGSDESVEFSAREESV